MIFGKVNFKAILYDLSLRGYLGKYNSFRWCYYSLNVWLFICFK